ncbi:hypothetical protein AB7M45_006085 [Bradyrhizobium elkanii]
MLAMQSAAPGKCHLGGYFWEGFGEEVCRSHAGLDRAERMLDGLTTLAHSLWVCIKALLHSLEQMLIWQYGQAE